jgi:branched-chain amino acid transport system permease protein
MNFRSLLQAGLAGALGGSLFALMALGLSLTWGFLKVINLAHFGLILLGSYLTFQLSTTTALGPISTIMVTVPVLFVVGAVLHLVYERFGVSELGSLLISYGVLIVLVQFVHNIWSADFQRMPASVNPYSTQSVGMAGMVFPLPVLLAAGFGLVLVVSASFVISRTYAGKALQAFGQDPDIASAFGIDHRLIGVVLAGAAGASAAIAGMLFALRGTLTPDAAFEWVGLVFAIVILGGIGKVAGTLFAGVLVGAVSGVAALLWTPSHSPLVVFSMVVLALVFRPRGLFHRTGSGN